MKRLTAIGASAWAVVAIMLGVPATQGESWNAQPIVVHEWGVEQFDWSGEATAATRGNVPSYMYTDAHPGAAMALAGKPVRELPRDSGERDKPILYFYPQFGSGGPPGPGIPIGVAMRFAKGNASAWYPQVNAYRPGDVAAARPEVTPVQEKRTPVIDLTDSATPPDNMRMQLEWSTLALSKEIPANLTLSGADLPADHWVKVAREAPAAAYVSNGKEAEKYLFYEGQTREQPAIAIVPKYGGYAGSPSTQIVNVSDRPIYDVFAVYHQSGHTWVGFVSHLDPMPNGIFAESGGVSVSTLPVPDFAGGVDWTDSASLPEATAGRLLSVLTEGGTIPVRSREWRNPADPQGATTSAQLFPDEAKALVKIWRHDLFDAGATDGLTIVYRQSPAQLDEDMPLQIFTDMYHYISLSRCGLVVIRNIDVKAALDAYTQISVAGATEWHSPADVQAKAIAFLRQHRGMALGDLAYFRKGNGRGNYVALRRAIDGAD